ncbi:hypothetical protein [Granulicoccus phenolivorans]|uniref:hypothetical protein n=1 Tax=Granulicoccus phenolivorans TaxID=266854 RepID=UPI000411B5CD|nr:hypothetical protein [Granulicoccus phenolivorans]
MSEAPQGARSGSRLARMFGYVTPEDRARWEQQRHEQEPALTQLRAAAAASLGALLEWHQTVTGSRFDAEQRTASQARFESSYARTSTRTRDPRTRSITEVVGFTAVDHRPRLEPDRQTGPDFER